MARPTISSSELAALGLDSRQIRDRMDDGRLRRLRHGVYTYARDEEEAEDRHRALIHATRKVVDPTNVISHTSAALIHGLPVRRPALERVTMTRTTAGHGDRGPHLLVRNTRITSSEIIELDGMPVTSLARTVADVARLEPMAWGVAAADAALAGGLAPGAVWEILGMHRRLAKVRQARRVMQFASPLAESPLESISRFNMWLAGLPAPEEQVEIFDDDGVFVARPDFLWREFGVVGECHGMVKYDELLKPGETPAMVLDRQHERAQRLRAMGFWVEDWDWDTAMSPERLGSLLGPALDRGRRRVV